MKLNEIRKAVEDYSAPGAAPPSPDYWANLKQKWAALKPQILSDYWPIIDDRIAIIDRRL
jgi:hypothetical protein